MDVIMDWGLTLCLTFVTTLEVPNKLNKKSPNWFDFLGKFSYYENWFGIITWIYVKIDYEIHNLHVSFP
jgi:hypothetical protein